jgi:hypothetical protein
MSEKIRSSQELTLEVVRHAQNVSATHDVPAADLHALHKVETDVASDMNVLLKLRLQMLQQSQDDVRRLQQVLPL